MTKHNLVFESSDFHASDCLVNIELRASKVEQVLTFLVYSAICAVYLTCLFVFKLTILPLIIILSSAIAMIFYLLKSSVKVYNHLIILANGTVLLGGNGSWSRFYVTETQNLSPIWINLIGSVLSSKLGYGLSQKKIAIPIWQASVDRITWQRLTMVSLWLTTHTKEKL